MIKPAPAVPCVTRATAHKDLVGAGELYLLVVAWSSSCLGFRRYALIIDRKSLFSSIFGKLTKKTFARAYNQVRG